MAACGTVGAGAARGAATKAVKSAPATSEAKGVLGGLRLRVEGLGFRVLGFRV